MLYLAWDRENNISLFFASPLYENEAPGLEQAAIVTLATRDNNIIYNNGCDQGDYLQLLVPGLLDHSCYLVLVKQRVR